MVVQLCNICETNESKYKCSKCLVPYCSLMCYKSPDHKHDTIATSNVQTKLKDQPIGPLITTNIDDGDTQILSVNETYKSILADEKFKYYLHHPVVQKELVKINQLIQLDGSYDFEKSNAYLLNLRKFGKHENVLIEEFCSMFTDLFQVSKTE